MDEIEIPSYFLCPISMQLMKDPVTVSTGITYDRESIEKWLFSCNNKSCPATKQILVSNDLTPNHTLRRLIQSWCTLNASNGVERIPTPKPAVNRTQISKLVDEARCRPESQLKCLRRLRSMAFSGEYNKNEIRSTPGCVDFLAEVVEKKEVATVEDSEFTKVSDEALTILNHLGPSDSDLKRFVSSEEGRFLDSLIHVLKFGNYQSRAAAIMVLKSVLDVADPAQLIAAKPEVFAETVQIIKDNISQQATKAALKFLAELTPWGRNRIKAAEAGAVQILAELLLDTSDRRLCELALTVLDQLCSCAEGRAELLRHGAGLAIVSKKILRVSHVASDRAVRILSSISKFSATSRVLQEMLQVGVVSKLCLVLQVDASLKTKERAKQILRLHSRVWRDSSCIPPALFSSYPS